MPLSPLALHSYALAVDFREPAAVCELVEVLACLALPRWFVPAVRWCAPEVQFGSAAEVPGDSAALHWPEQAVDFPGRGAR